MTLRDPLEHKPKNVCNYDLGKNFNMLHRAVFSNSRKPGGGLNPSRIDRVNIAIVKLEHNWFFLYVFFVTHLLFMTEVDDHKQIWIHNPGA